MERPVDIVRSYILTVDNGGEKSWRMCCLGAMETCVGKERKSELTTPFCGRTPVGAAPAPPYWKVSQKRRNLGLLEGLASTPAFPLPVAAAAPLPLPLPFALLKKRVLVNLFVHKVLDFRRIKI